MLSRLNMKEIEMESLFEEEQRLGHICLKPATIASTILAQRSVISDDDEHSSRSTIPKNSSSSETHDDDDDRESTTFDENSSNTRVQHPLLYSQLLGNSNNNNNGGGAVDLSRTEVKTGNLLTAIPNKSPAPLTPSPSPPNESLLQILANQILKTKQQEPIATSRLLTIASPTESKPNVSSLKRNLNQIQQDDEQQQKWDEAAMTLLSLNKPPPPPPAPVEQQTALQSVCQSVINGLLRKPNPPRATIDYHSHNHQPIQGENFHHHHQDNINSLSQLKILMNYFSTSSNNSFPMPPLQQPSTCISEQTNPILPTHTQSHEPRGDMMPLKLRMKMLNAKS
jgi:hypothetical protein